jgi:hypothetical protein
MKLLLPLAGALALAGCTTASNHRAPDRGWIVGRWCPEGRLVHAGMGVMLRPTLFNDDGTYSTFEERGRWQLEGVRLLRLSQHNVRYDQLVERLGRNRMARSLAGDPRQIWRRCTKGA